LRDILGPDDDALAVALPRGESGGRLTPGPPAEPRLPSPSFVRATATLAADLALGLDADATSARAAPHVATALDLVLEAAEAAVATVWQAGDGTSTGGRALALAVALARSAPPLLVHAAGSGVDASLDAAERVHALMRSAARLTDEVGGGSGDGDADAANTPWTWDVVGDGDGDGPAAPAAQDPAEALTDALSAALTAALAASWAAGPAGQEKVKAALVPLADLDAAGGASSAEQQAELLTAGRLAARLAGDADLLAVAVPLLSESGVAAAAPAARAAAAHVSACLAALAAAGRGGAGWAYDAQCDALVKAYKVPDGVGAPLLHSGGDPDSPAAGALARALTTLASGLATAAAPVRRDALVRLLALFADVGGALEGDDPGCVADLAALLPAIAAVADAAWTDEAKEGGGEWTDAEQVVAATTTAASLPSSSTAPRLHAATDADIIKSFRLLWLYVGVHGLAGVRGRGAAAGTGVSARITSACGAIAAVTPQLAVLDEGDTSKLTAELGPRVARLGASVAGRAVAAVAHLIGPPPPGAPHLTPADPVRALHILSVATLELARAEAAPLGACVARDGGDGLPSAASPLDALLDALQDAEPGVWSAPWLAGIADAAASSYCGRLAVEGREHGKVGVVRRGRHHGAADATAPHHHHDLVTPALEQLVGSLIAASARGGGAPGAPGSPTRMLHTVLSRFPSLHWRPVLLQAALASVDSQEAARKRAAAGATGGNGGAGTHPGLDLALRVVAEAARAAPAHAEALLHEPLRGGVSGGDRDGGAVPAALRHAADLMAALDAARPAAVEVDGGEGPIAGVEALSRKSYYGGAAAARAAAGPGGLADAVASLTAALADHAPQRDVDDRVLATAAALATSPDDASAPVALRALAAVPAKRLRPGAVRVASLAWEWVAAAAPGLRVPLVAAVAAAWLATVDAQAGLFSRSYDADAVHMGAGGDPDDHVDLTRGVKAHAAWLEYWDEVWQV
jgi:hypothetical protein